MDHTEPNAATVEAVNDLLGDRADLLQQTGDALHTAAQQRDGAY